MELTLRREELKSKKIEIRLESDGVELERDEPLYRDLTYIFLEMIYERRSR